MLKYNEFSKILESQHSLSESKVQECYELLRFDAGRDLRLVSKLYTLYSAKLVPQGITYSHELHSIIQLYLKRKSEYGAYELSELYFLEVIYFFYANSLSECIHYVNILQDSPSTPINFKVASLSYAITVLSKRSLLTELARYIDLTLKYLDSNEIDDRQRTIIHLNLLDIYALRNDKKRYLQSSKQLKEFYEHATDEALKRQLAFYMEIHNLNHRVLLNLGDTNETLYKDLQKSMMMIKGASDISDDYAMILLPVFRKLDKQLTTSEKVEYITILLNQETSIEDKIEMYNYLFVEEEIDKFTYPDLMQDYYKILQEYYNDSKINKTHEIITELENYQMSLDYTKVKIEMDTDPMTGIYNRIAYERVFPKIKEEFEEHDFETGAVCVFDLDGLKAINDTKGHEAGDALIMAGASALKEVFTSEMYRLYRIGGDEFVCFAINVSEEDIIEAFRKLEEKEAELQVSISKGYAFMNRKDENPVGKAFAKADENMYQCKEEHHKKLPRIA